MKWWNMGRINAFICGSLITGASADIALHRPLWWICIGFAFGIANGVIWLATYK